MSAAVRSKRHLYKVRGGEATLTPVKARISYTRHPVQYLHVRPDEFDVDLGLVFVRRALTE